jgi:hypothetical protein
MLITTIALALNRRGGNTPKNKTGVEKDRRRQEGEKKREGYTPASARDLICPSTQIGQQQQQHCPTGKTRRLLLYR